MWGRFFSGYLEIPSSSTLLFETERASHLTHPRRRRSARQTHFALSLAVTLMTQPTLDGCAFESYRANGRDDPRNRLMNLLFECFYSLFFSSHLLAP